MNDNDIDAMSVRYPLPDGRTIETAYPHIDYPLEDKEGWVKLFVSMPMSGKTSEEIGAEMEKAGAAVANWLSRPVHRLESFVDAYDVPEGVNRSLWMLGKSIQALSEADIAYFADGWMAARGCVIEHFCAERYGVYILEASEMVGDDK